MFSDYSVVADQLDKINLSKDETVENISIPQPLLDDSSFLKNESTLTEINNTLDWTEAMSGDFLISNIIKSSGFLDGDSNDQINNVRSIHQEVDLARMKYNRSKFLINALDELFNNSSVLPSDLKEKSSSELRQKLFECAFSTNKNFLHLFNGDGCEDVSLNVKEICVIRTSIKNLLSSKCLQMKAENEIVSDVLGSHSNNIYLPGSLLSQEEVEIFNRLEKLACTVNNCSENVETVRNFVGEIYDVRVAKLRESQRFEFASLKSKSKLIHLQLKNLNFTIEKALIEEYENITEAVYLLFKELKALVAEEEYSLQKARVLKESYNKVRESRKFDEILDQYKSLRDLLKHKHWAMKQLKQ